MRYIYFSLDAQSNYLLHALQYRSRGLDVLSELSNLNMNLNFQNCSPLWSVLLAAR